MRFCIITPFALAAVVLAAAAPASAAPRFLGKFGNWRAYSNNNEHGLFCYAASQPSSMAASAVKRGRAYFMISDQPVRNVVEEPMIMSGYAAHDGNALTVSVGSQTFDFFMQGGDGWIARLSENGKLMQALRSNSMAVISGTGPGGMVMRDTYGLAGLTQAMAKARTACGGVVS